ncbi:heterokaryon incompatibility protein-domain-containing protein [Chaetomium tenue]|uniref:Heterokaryon incompatibility protein-domain-containing protein n=1 Tax=Chaetomium tenue TaxID=1854479 RepID=A0ACB7PJG5_9PEZI|nr:heterokaryon incompatibility protein-domain-containing protein [Chaetomium globosum]
MNEALCDLCKLLFEGGLEAKKLNIDEEWDDEEVWGLAKPARPHHGSVRDLVECGQTRCLLCAALWASVAEEEKKDLWLKPDSVQQSGPEISLAVRLNPHKDGRTFTIKMVLVKFGMEDTREITFYATEEPDPCLHHVTQRLLLRPGEKLEFTASPRSMEWVRQMMQECTSGHDRCNNTPTSWLPSRLIHLGGPSQLPRVVETARLSPGLDTSPAIKYTTLSHCWGTVGTFKLFEENRKELYQGIAPSSIPKTYLEAMEVTESLGLQYIWIDSLCIIQDDPDDWQRECTNMADVYRYGYYNIAALEATDSHGGCFRQRDPAHISSVIVETKWEVQDRCLWETRPFPYRSSIPQEIEKSPLQRRAWVLQERHMAARILHFGQKAVFWECRTLVGCQSGDVFKNPSLLSYGAPNAPKLSQQEVRHILWIWSYIATRYTKAALIFKSDRFIAISAVARQIQPILSSEMTAKVEYLAGLWTLLLEYQLMWSSDSPDTATRISEVDQLAAPSWLWASLNGPVTAYILPWIHTFQVAIARVVRHTIVPKFGDPFFGPEAQSKSVLEINGLLWRLANPTRSREHHHMYPSNHPVHVAISFRWDTTSRLPDVETAIFLLPVIFDRPTKSNPLPPARNDGPISLGGLILHQVDDSTPRLSFQRIGTFSIGVLRASPALRGKAWRERLDKCIVLVLEHGIVWPSQYDNQPPPSIPAHKIWMKATSHRTIFLE